jgi:2-polyprenyl-3-methyl-5-hydroxy-6-metoxy-1,4-benzoquinol methylase
MDLINVINQIETKFLHMNEYKNIQKCRCCNSSVSCILDLSEQPLANSYHKIDECLSSYPLKLNLCNNCFHLQLSVVVNPDLMFKNYLYVSGTTETLRNYFDFFSKFTVQRFKSYSSRKPINVLDIACNDGSQLDSYKKIGLITYGIDPAENLYKLSSINHNIVCDYFSSEKLKENFDIIVAQNVFAHTDNIETFLNDCNKKLNADGLIYIQTSQANMIINNEFDTIYHEHLSFFNTLSMKHIVEKCGLKLNNVFKFDIHGTSYVFEIGKYSKDTNIKSILDQEKKIGLYRKKTYNLFSKNAKKITKDLKISIETYKKNGYKIIGYGAAAKGMTLLNFGKIKLDYIIDDNPLKTSLLTPGMDIPIESISILNEMKNDKIVFVPLAWNFFDEICKRIKNVRTSGDDLFLMYFPTIKVYKN